MLPLTRARITFPRADRDRHSPAAVLPLLSLPFSPPSTFTQLPRSIRWSLLRPPDTGERERGREREGQEGKEGPRERDRKRERGRKKRGQRKIGETEGYINHCIPEHTIQHFIPQHF